MNKMILSGVVGAITAGLGGMILTSKIEKATREYAKAKLDSEKEPETDEERMEKLREGMRNLGYEI